MERNGIKIDQMQLFATSFGKRIIAPTGIESSENQTGG